VVNTLWKGTSKLVEQLTTKVNGSFGGGFPSPQLKAHAAPWEMPNAGEGRFRWIEVGAGAGILRVFLCG